MSKNLPKRVAATAAVGLILSGAVAPALSVIPGSPIVAKADEAPTNESTITVNYVDENGVVFETSQVSGVIGSETQILAQQRFGYNPELSAVNSSNIVGAEAGDVINNYSPGVGSKTTLSFTGKFGAGNKVVNFHYSVFKVKNTVVMRDIETGGTQLKAFEIEGQEGTQYPDEVNAQIEDLKNQGYELSSNSSTNIFTDTTDPIYVDFVHGKTVENEAQTKTRTVFSKANQVQVYGPTVQTVNFSREAITDNVTKALSYTPWLTESGNTAGAFEEVQPRTIYGYDANANQTAEFQVVTPDTVENTETTIQYTPKTVNANITVLDTEKDEAGVVVSHDLVTGLFGTTSIFNPAEKIAELIGKGYSIVSNNLGDQVKFDTEDVKNYSVVVKHRHEVTTETSTAKRTINFKYSDGDKAGEPVVQAVTFTRTVDKDLVTGETSNSAWQGAGGWEEYKVPTMKGYTADTTTIAANDTVGQGTPDAELDVVYKANSEEAKVVYIDQDTKTTAASDRYVGDYNTKIKFTGSTLSDLIKAGYEVISDGTQGTHKFDEADEVKVINVFLKHGIDKTSETKDVTRNLTLKDKETGKAIKEVNQVVSFTRSVETDKVTGSVTKGNWVATSPQFNALTLPEIDGYVLVDGDGKVPAEAVTVDSENSGKEYFYKKVVAPAPAPAEGNKGEGNQASTGVTTSEKAATTEAEAKADDTETGTEVPTFMTSAGLLILGAFAFLTGKANSKKANDAGRK